MGRAAFGPESWCKILARGACFFQSPSALTSGLMETLGGLPLLVCPPPPRSRPEVRADGPEVRADGPEVRADGPEVRADGSYDFSFLIN